MLLGFFLLCYSPLCLFFPLFLFSLVPPRRQDGHSVPWTTQQAGRGAWHSGLPRSPQNTHTHTQTHALETLSLTAWIYLNVSPPACGWAIVRVRAVRVRTLFIVLSFTSLPMFAPVTFQALDSRSLQSWRVVGVAKAVGN